MPRKITPRPNKTKLRRTEEVQSQSDNNFPPVFCFHYLQADYDLTNCDQAQKALLLESLYTRSQMTWQEIINTSKATLGTETIHRKYINATIPSYFGTNEKFYVLRIAGKKGRTAGFRAGRIFHVVWVDYSFSLYKHG